MDVGNYNKNNNMEQNDELLQLGDFDQSIDQIVMCQLESDLNFDTLNNKRRSSDQIHGSFTYKSSLEHIKLGSLEAFFADDDGFDDKEFNVITKDTASKELITYFSLLGKPENTEDVDYTALHTLLSLADVNVRDIHGQTIMHEVAREWSTDLANFLRIKGVHIDNEDNWGRTPLFVAAASNYTEMVSWLIDNGADINHRTIKGEQQTPIHVAAKYDAVEVFHMLMERGVNVLERDAQNQDPFFLAAKAGNIRICKVMLELELPTASYAHSGEATIDHIIENLPLEFAERALNQFIGINKSTGNIKLYLSCLGKRRWRLLSKYRNTNALLPGATPPTPLEIITRRGILTLANHPVMLKLIKLKYEKVGKQLIQLNIILHIVFTILWTCAASIRTPEDEHDHTTGKHVILGLTLVAQLLTFVFIYKLIREYTSLRVLIEDERKRLLKQYKTIKVFCHPRWQMDKEMLKNIRDKAKNMRTQFWESGWTIIESLCLLMACVNTVITIVWYAEVTTKKKSVLPEVRMYYSVVFVILVWIRLNRAFRSHRSFGPFVAMLGQCAISSVKIGFLFFEFFIPLSVMCWVTFGGDRLLYADADNISQLSVEYEKINDMLYQLYLLSFGGDYDYDTLNVIDSTMAHIFVGVYFLLLTIITINIYIALLSEAAARVIATAKQRADLEESDSCGKVERTFPAQKRKFDVFLDKYCSPLEIQLSEFRPPSMFDPSSTRKVISDASVTLLALSELVQNIIQEQISTKKDLQYVEGELQTYLEKYNKEDMEDITKKVSSVFKYQLHPVVRVVKKTDDRIMQYIKRIKGNRNIKLQFIE